MGGRGREGIFSNLTYDACLSVCWFYVPVLVLCTCVGSMYLCLFAPVLLRLLGLVIRRPPRERKVPGSNPACAGIFSGSSHTSDLKIGIPVATLPIPLAL